MTEGDPIISLPLTQPFSLTQSPSKFNLHFLRTQESKSRASTNIESFLSSEILLFPLNLADLLNLEGERHKRERASARVLINFKQR